MLSREQGTNKGHLENKTQINAAIEVMQSDRKLGRIKTQKNNAGIAQGIMAKEKIPWLENIALRPSDTI